MAAGSISAERQLDPRITEILPLPCQTGSKPAPTSSALRVMVLTRGSSSKSLGNPGLLESPTLPVYAPADFGVGPQMPLEDGHEPMIRAIDAE